MTHPPLPFPTLAPHEQGSMSATDGTSLFTQTWLPEDDPVGGVVVVHGYGEHSGRYGHLAAELVGRGLAVFAYDQRGYGRSGGKTAFVDQFETYVDDLAGVVTRVQTQLGDLPLFVYGHSMGGLVVLRYALTHAPDVRGLLLSAPAIEIDPDLAPLLRKASRLLGTYLPTLPTVKSPEGAISRDPAVVQHASDDPLNYHGRVLARTGAEMLRAGDATKDELSALTLPFFVFHGTDDVLTSPGWSRILHERAASDDKTIELYDGLYHEVHNEPERERVLTDIADWVQARL